MSNSSNLDNYFGPFKTRQEAIDTVVWTCGECCGILWEKDSEFWSNDGVDPDTGKVFNVIPVGATWVNMMESD